MVVLIVQLSITVYNVVVRLVFLEIHSLVVQHQLKSVIATVIAMKQETFALKNVQVTTIVPVDKLVIRENVVQHVRPGHVIRVNCVKMELVCLGVNQTQIAHQTVPVSTDNVWTHVQEKEFAVKTPFVEL